MLTHKPGSAPRKPISQARLVQPGPDSTTTVEKERKKLSGDETRPR